MNIMRQIACVFFMLIEVLPVAADPITARKLTDTGHAVDLRQGSEVNYWRPKPACHP